MIWVWIGVIVVAVIVEVLSAQLLSIWFALGGIAGLITSCLTDNIAVCSICSSFCHSARRYLSVCAKITQKSTCKHKCRQIHRQNGSSYRGYIQH